MPFLYLIHLHCRAVLVLFPNTDIIQGNKQINHDRWQKKNQNLSSVSGPFPFSRETTSCGLKQCIDRNCIWNKASVMSRRTCIATLPFIPCEHRLSYKEKNQFPFYWCAAASGVGWIRASVICNSTRNWFWYKMQEASIQLKLQLPYIDLAQNICDICQKCHRDWNNYQQHLSLTERKAQGVLWEGKRKQLSSSTGGSCVLPSCIPSQSMIQLAPLTSSVVAPQLPLSLCFPIHPRSHTKQRSPF